MLASLPANSSKVRTRFARESGADRVSGFVVAAGEGVVLIEAAAGVARSGRTVDA
jgi:hypothetical protein